MIVKKLATVSDGWFPGAEYNEDKVGKGAAELLGAANVDGSVLRRIQACHAAELSCREEVEGYLQQCSRTFGNTRSTRW